ncbi:hypothetical protein BJ969_001121 [Saccharopolyspora gloriosae]|uniref:Uncharacterized protein n=1 Tax=Saccharopolyspora gloriosae TaxID=455344 RepID=A0A840NCG3_9PSEU|nr:hypothetical protein [Saccharopolyspora gloriosae]
MRTPVEPAPSSRVTGSTSGSRGDVHDPAAVAQPLQTALHDEERRAGVDREQPVVVLLGDVRDRAGQRDPRVVDEDVRAGGGVGRGRVRAYVTLRDGDGVRRGRLLRGTVEHLAG